MAAWQMWRRPEFAAGGGVEGVHRFALGGKKDHISIDHERGPIGRAQALGARNRLRLPQRRAAGAVHRDDALAVEAIACVRHALPQVVARPDDVDARGTMLYAASVAGMVISQTGTTMVHALGYHLTLKHGVAHGRANAALIAHGLDFNYEASPDKIGRVYEIFGGGRDRSGVAALEAWLHGLGVGTRLSHYGVTADEIAGYAAYVMTKGNTKASPRVVKSGDMLELLKKML
jgi:alcohol dehydrogenase class IV